MTLAAILGLSGPDLTDDEAVFLAEARPWGLVLFARNIDHGPDGADRLRRLIGQARAAVGAAAPVFVDQEGGTVQRLRPPLARAWPDAAGGAAGGPRAVWLRHRLMAAELAGFGIDGNFAPVVDLGGPGTHPFLRRRIWSDDPVALAGLARAAGEGLLAGGVLPVVKHLPGHGGADADSHHALPGDARPLADLAARDFAVVRALADMALGMTAHVRFPALDPDLPATLSPAVIGYLRGVLGFRGLLMTDDIGMHALGGDMGGRAARAIAAGCDLVLHCSGVLDEMQAVAGAAGPLTGPAAARAGAALALRRTPDPIDTAALEAEFEGLQGGAIG